MQLKYIAILILLPFAAVFIYAAIHEFRRYRSKGKANYGLVYDEETGTTHLAGIDNENEAYDPEEFDPDAYNNRDVESESKTKSDPGRS